ncbi:MAG: hypothetical protein ACUVS2_05270 [Candidatus Flexifilum sp.]|jgi:hypothetical protein
MSADHLVHYGLYPDGSIRHWLACGPILSDLTTTIEGVIDRTGPAFGEGRRWVLNYWAWSPASKRIKQRIYRALPPFTWTPGARPQHHAAGIDGKPWEYRTAEDDQVIDFSLFNFTPTLMQAWLFAGLEAPSAGVYQAELITIGPARIVVNGLQTVHYAEAFSYVEVQRIPVTLTLNAGLNEIYLHGEMLGWREARLALGLRVSAAADLRIAIPIGAIDPERWQRAEAGLQALRVRQFAFPKLPGLIQLSPQGQPFSFDAVVELPIPENIFAQLDRLERPRGISRLALQPGQAGELPIVTEVTAGMSGMPGENSLRLTLTPADGTPLTVQREIWAGRNSFSSTPYGDYESRRREALEHLAAMPFDVPASMAALELERVTHVSSEAVALACHFMERRYDCADFYAVGLLALLHRFPEAIRPEDYERIERAFLGFKYWIDEPGIDAMCYFTENHQILFHVAAYLAGQRWPDRIFTNSGLTGQQQMNRARARIEPWILTRLRGSFSEWDSNAYMTLDAFAMLALIDHARSARLRELATTLLHKLFFLLACQSFRGVHGSTHGRCYVTALKSARVENTSSLQRIAWGMGIFNGETRATGLLALSRRYRVPDILQRIGADIATPIVTQAHSKARFRPRFDMRGDEWEVRTITYRSPDVMLSAAVDYHPGEFGIQEHLWQATLGPEASIFTNYPGNSQEHGNARPNFWAGSVRLPRVGMHDRTVICLYPIDPAVGLGFSHAYFPTAAFDEWILDGGWAFARSGGGYVALWGDGDLVLTEDGCHAGQELRVRGPGKVWIAYVGSAVEHGDFGRFRADVMRHTPQVEHDRVRWETPDGQRLLFGWTGPLIVNDEPQNWADMPHYDNRYTHTPMDAERMTIRHGGEALILDLLKGTSVLRTDDGVS